jgi:hypothetical protein
VGRRSVGTESAFRASQEQLGKVGLMHLPLESILTFNIPIS